MISKDEAIKMLREALDDGTTGFSRLLIATSDDPAVRKWQAGARKALAATTPDKIEDDLRIKELEAERVMWIDEVAKRGLRAIDAERERDQLRQQCEKETASRVLEQECIVRLRQQLKAKILEAHNAANQLAAAERDAAHDEDLLETLYWEFDAERKKKSRDERLVFKGKLRWYATHTLGINTDIATFQKIQSIVVDQSQPLGNRLQSVAAVIHFAMERVTSNGDRPEPAKDNAAISASTEQTSAPVKEESAEPKTNNLALDLIAAAEKYAEPYEYKTDVLNAFYHGSDWQRRRDRPPRQAVNPVAVHWNVWLPEMNWWLLTDATTARAYKDKGFEVHALGKIGTPISVPEDLLTQIDNRLRSQPDALIDEFRRIVAALTGSGK